MVEVDAEVGVDGVVGVNADAVVAVGGVDVVVLIAPLVQGCPVQQGLEGTGVPVVRQLHS